MPSARVPEVLTDLLPEHGAVQAWAHVHPGPAHTRSIEVLKRKRRNAVFRIDGLTGEGGTIIAKRTRYATGEVERLIYEHILPRVPLPSLRCHGFVRDADRQLCWLFLDDAGRDPYVVKDRRHRTLAGQWLADTHLVDVPVQISSQLPARDVGHYLAMLHDCRAQLSEHLAEAQASSDLAALLTRILAFYDILESHWGVIANTCAVMPQALVHGDFVVKNLHVRNGTSDDALLVFDWQFAGWGVPATDLAQFIDRVASPDLDAYLCRMRTAGRPLRSADLRAVAACGNLLRILDEMRWAMTGLRAGEPKTLTSVAAHLYLYIETVPDAWRVFRRRCA